MDVTGISPGWGSTTSRRFIRYTTCESYLGEQFVTRLAHFNLQLENSCHDQTFQNLIFLLNVAFFTRYEFVSSNLEKSERERLFDEHIDLLVAKKKDNFRKMLDECKAITLESSFKEIKKLIKDDLRYSRYSSSDRKCEKQFNEYMKDR